VEHDTNARAEAIRERAYVLWENSDRRGSATDYWLQAEREIDAARSAPATTAAGKTIVFPERTPRAPRRPAVAKDADTAKPGKTKSAKDKPAKAKAVKDKPPKPKAKAKPKPKSKAKPKESFRA
jgi:hypothetical protein